MEKDLELVTYKNSCYICSQNKNGNFWQRNGKQVLAAYLSHDRYIELKSSLAEIGKQGVNRKFREKLIADENQQGYRGENGVILFLNSGKDEPIRHSSLARKIYDSKIAYEPAKKPSDSSELAELIK